MTTKELKKKCSSRPEGRVERGNKEADWAGKADQAVPRSRADKQGGTTGE